MEKFERLNATAAPLPLDNIDTDKILPGEFLKTVERKGLGQALFARMRYRDDGSPNPDFILNREPWTKAGILVAGGNFGCGSSREHAPWALVDFGIRCIIARSFADIFYNNCFKNGILPITLEQGEFDRLCKLASKPGSASMQVDLAGQTVLASSGANVQFAIDPGRKRALLEGRDEIAETLSLTRTLEAWKKANRHAVGPLVPRISLE